MLSSKCVYATLLHRFFNESTECYAMLCYAICAFRLPEVLTNEFPLPLRANSKQSVGIPPAPDSPSPTQIPSSAHIIQLNKTIRNIGRVDLIISSARISDEPKLRLFVVKALAAIRRSSFEIGVFGESRRQNRRRIKAKIIQEPKTKWRPPDRIKTATGDRKNRPSLPSGVSGGQIELIDRHFSYPHQRSSQDSGMGGGGGMHFNILFFGQKVLSFKLYYLVLSSAFSSLELIL